MFRLFGPFCAELVRVTRTFATDVSSRVIVAITPVVSVALVIWFIGYGLLVMRGAVHEPVGDFFAKVVRTAVIVSVALSAGFYQGQIASLVQALPDELSAVVMGREAVRYGVDNEPLPLGVAGSEQGQPGLVDRAAGQGFAKAADAFEKSSLLSKQGVAFGIFGFLLLIATVVMVGLGGAMVVMAKLILAILAALGPIFIVTLLFEATKGFFGRWVGMVVTYTLMVVLLACVFTLLLAIFANFMSGVNLDGTGNLSYAVGGALLLTFLSVYLIRETHHLAMGLGGGLAHGVRMRDVIKMRHW